MARPGRKEHQALQAEVNTEEEWQELLKQKGLILADVYSKAFGPCIAMRSTLRKVKFLFGGDTINYAVVENDEIPDLERFRDNCKPVWMFLENGQMVNLMFGANCPELTDLLTREIRRVQRNEESEMRLEPSARTPEEETLWQKKEAIRYDVPRSTIPKNLPFAQS